MSSAAALFHSGDPKTNLHCEFGSIAGFLSHPTNHSATSRDDIGLVMFMASFSSYFLIRFGGQKRNSGTIHGNKRRLVATSE